jgi:Ion channel
MADRPAQFRYGVVFALMLALVVFLIAAPSADWSHAVALAIGGAALVFALATARERKDVRYLNALAVGTVLLVMVIAVATGTAAWQLTDGVGAVVTAAIPLVIFRGVVRLLRDQGVTLQAVAGALAIYLAVGLLFAWIIGFIAHIDSTPYFAQHTSGTEGDRVYFSFTVLTTTGFGDFSAGTPAGHALAVIEMLTGQLYLVTVIGLLIGNLGSRRKADTTRARHQTMPEPKTQAAGGNKSLPNQEKS